MLFILSSFFSVGQIFNNELFGAVAEEKEVKGIVSKLMEARHSKSMDSYEFLAQFCSKESITKFILPLKEVSRNFMQKKIFKKMLKYTRVHMYLNSDDGVCKSFLKERPK